jgi:hypothetical protein
MIVLTPVWALIEWQDNGGFERFGSGSQPAEREPWILYRRCLGARHRGLRPSRVHVSDSDPEGVDGQLSE